MNIIKKIVLLHTVFAISLIVKTSEANAQTPIEITNPISTGSFSDLIENVLLWVLGIAGSLSLLMLITGGVLYVIAAGDEQKAESAKKMITWTILGLALILASYSIVVVLDGILT